MDQFRYVIYGLFSAFGVMYALNATKRTPEQIMREEKAAIQTFVTRKTGLEALCLIKNLAISHGFAVDRSDEFCIVLTSGASMFSWGYIMCVKAEMPNDWSSKVTLELYSKAETGYGNSVMRKRRIQAFTEAVRNELQANQ